MKTTSVIEKMNRKSNIKKNNNSKKTLLKILKIRPF